MTRTLIGSIALVLALGAIALPASAHRGSGRTVETKPAIAGQAKQAVYSKMIWICRGTMGCQDYEPYMAVTGTAEDINAAANLISREHPDWSISVRNAE